MWLSQYYDRANGACMLTLRLLSMALNLSDLPGLYLVALGIAAGAFGILMRRVYEDFGLHFGTIPDLFDRGFDWLFDGHKATSDEFSVFDSFWSKVENITSAWDVILLMSDVRWQLLCVHTWHDNQDPEVQQFAFAMSRHGWRFAKRSIILIIHAGWLDQNGKGKLICHSLYACTLGYILQVGSSSELFVNFHAQYPCVMA